MVLANLPLQRVKYPGLSAGLISSKRDGIQFAVLLHYVCITLTYYIWLKVVKVRCPGVYRVISSRPCCCTSHWCSFSHWQYPSSLLVTGIIASATDLCILVYSGCDLDWLPCILREPRDSKGWLEKGHLMSGAGDPEGFRDPKARGGKKQRRAG